MPGVDHSHCNAAVFVWDFVFAPILWLNVAVAGGALVYSVYLLSSGTSRVTKIDEDRAFMFASSAPTVALCTLVGMLAASVIAWSHFVPLVYLP